MEMAQNNHLRPLIGQHLLEARHPFTVPIQNQDLVEFGIKLLGAGDDACRSPEVAATPVCEGRGLRARGRKNFVEDIAKKLNVLRGRHATESRDDIVLHGKLAEERNARHLRLSAEHLIRREAGQSHCLVAGVFQRGPGKPGPEGRQAGHRLVGPLIVPLSVVAIAD
jgi:hypothetical protein